ncbi:hypothetical protein [Streptococcus sp. E17BB]|uniref:hypothetical protein n=1 Tax=Streptococcus sp. E17BB TaxID=3278714 RepID=UPI00359CE8FF
MIELEKYKLVLEFEEANRPLSICEKQALLPYSLGYVQAGLNSLEKDYCAGRYV